MMKLVEILPHTIRDVQGNKAAGAAPVAMRGGIVNVLAKLSKVQTMLPRKLEEGQMIGVGLHRALDFKWAVASGHVRPDKVMAALSELTKQELCQELGIVIRPNWVESCGLPKITNEGEGHQLLETQTCSTSVVISENPRSSPDVDPPSEVDKALTQPSQDEKVLSFAHDDEEQQMPNACFKCGQQGHLSWECPNTGGQYLR